MREQHETVIIGGGQAGLAMSYHLSRRGREHIILERRRVGERWRSERWDSLRFQLPNWALELPGKAYSGSDPDGFSHHPDVLRFVLDYAEEIRAPVRTGIEVTGLKQSEGKRSYTLDTTEGTIEAQTVVIATGPFQRPLIPSCSNEIPSSVYQTDATHYRNPDQLPPGSVLVAGSGNSGCQIADELQHSGRRVFLAISRHNRAPRRYRGKDLIWWYENLGRFDVNIDSFPGRRYPPTVIMTGIGGGHDLDARHLAAAGVTLVGRIRGVSGGKLALADDLTEILAASDKSHAGFIAAADTLAATPALRSGLKPKEEIAPPSPLRPDEFLTLDLRKENIGTIIWATGHCFNFDWVKIPILDDKGTPVQQRGVTACPGVYFLGLHWMHTFRSAIFPFVGRDAAYLAEHLDQLRRG
jgi:putative flavoprotein involved in K+ transport